MLCKQDGSTYRQTNEQTDKMDNPNTRCCQQTFQARGIKNRNKLTLRIMVPHTATNLTLK